MCAPEQLRQYHSLDDLSWEKWGVSHGGVERIDLENNANPEEADKLEGMTADETAFDGYYMVAGISSDGYKKN